VDGAKFQRRNGFAMAMAFVYLYTRSHFLCKRHGLPRKSQQMIFANKKKKEKKRRKHLSSSKKM
jgi:hypothetical protein